MTLENSGSVANIISTMWRYALTALLLVQCLGAPSADKMNKVPGYPQNYSTDVYTGYLDVGVNTRKLHYVFVEGAAGPKNKLPLTLWLNGGPGCSSLLGFLQEIGPFYLQDGIDYKRGDLLTPNPYSWHQVSNLLFLQSPAGVGYSYNNEIPYHHTDVLTAEDNFQAMLSFYAKFPQYRGSNLWLTGESYAGKYIPDLAVKIDKYNIANPATPLNMKGIMVGNGIMSFDNLQDSEVSFLMGRSFVDPETKQYYSTSCQHDEDSAGCRFFKIRLQQDTDELNPYNVYGYCYYNDSFTAKASQSSILLKLKQQYGRNKTQPKFNGAPCAYFDGIALYFNTHQVEYKAAFPDMIWNGPCAQNISYTIDPSGSLPQYSYLLGRLRDKSYTLHLYNGNWDDVVPYHDTIANIRALSLLQSYIYTPWFTNRQHSGFQQLFSGFIFTIVKGASHQVPQSKRAESLQLFNSTLEGNKELYRKVKEQGIQLPQMKHHQEKMQAIVN